MDDFGSGYSSLNILAELPIDVLKLDMKFIQKEQMNKNSNNIMSAIVNLAKWMNLLVIAEGVETQEQIDYLKDLRCDFVQGCYFSKPLPWDTFADKVKMTPLEPLFDMKSFVDIESAANEETERKAGVILIADDLKMNQMILTDCLKENYTIVKADNGAIAWNYLQTNHEKISMVITDLYMPMLDGDELLELMKTSEYTKEIPVIMTSAKADNRLIEQLMDKGIAGFLRKPFEKEEALQMVSDVLEEHNKKVLKRLREVENIARQDGLTGLYNRSELEHQINEYFVQKPSGRGLFIILDIDNFKGVNDTFGHAAGDEALQKVAGLIRECFRQEDVVCPIGGDEFAVFVMKRFTHEELHSRLELLCEKLRFEIEGMYVSCSVGACQSPQFASDYQNLYEKADTALLKAKRMGKNQYQIYGLEV